MGDTLRLIDAAIRQATEANQCGLCGLLLDHTQASLDFCSWDCQRQWQYQQADGYMPDTHRGAQYVVSRGNPTVDVRYPEAVPFDPFRPQLDHLEHLLVQQRSYMARFGSPNPDITEWIDDILRENMPHPEFARMALARPDVDHTRPWSSQCSRGVIAVLNEVEPVTNLPGNGIARLRAWLTIRTAWQAGLDYIDGLGRRWGRPDL